MFKLGTFVSVAAFVLFLSISSTGQVYGNANVCTNVIEVKNSLEMHHGATLALRPQMEQVKTLVRRGFRGSRKSRNSKLMEYVAVRKCELSRKTRDLGRMMKKGVSKTMHTCYTCKQVVKVRNLMPRKKRNRLRALLKKMRPRNQRKSRFRVWLEKIGFRKKRKSGVSAYFQGY